MRRILLIVLLLCAGAGSGSAAGYDDFTRGMSANFHGDSDAAIAAFTSAIAAPDLNPVWLPQAYRFRAETYLTEERCPPALADLDAALKLTPGLPEALVLHSKAALCLKRFDVSLTDESALIDAGYTWELRVRAVLRWRLGDLAGATADLTTFDPVGRGDGYAALWLATLQARTGTAKPAPAQDATPPAAETPAPSQDASATDDGTPNAIKGVAPPVRHSHEVGDRLLELFAGRLKPEDILAPGAGQDAPRSVFDQCIAAFYIGEWWLAHGDAASAKPLLKAAAATSCAPGTIEHDLAQAELVRLKG